MISERLLYTSLPAQLYKFTSYALADLTILFAAHQYIPYQGIWRLESEHWHVQVGGAVAGEVGCIP